MGASTANLVSGQQKILRLYLIGAISSAASADSSFNRISPRNVTFSALEMGGHESEYKLEGNGPVERPCERTGPAGCK